MIIDLNRPKTIITNLKLRDNRHKAMIIDLKQSV